MNSVTKEKFWIDKFELRKIIWVSGNSASYKFRTGMNLYKGKVFLQMTMVLEPKVPGICWQYE